MEENSNCFASLFEMVEEEKEWSSAKEVHENYEKGKREALDLINYIEKRFNEIGEKAESAIYIASFLDTLLGTSINNIGSTLGEERQKQAELLIMGMFS